MRICQCSCIFSLQRYREASAEVMEVMSRFAVIERASIDEAYMDLTKAVQERLQKMQGQPIAAEQLATTYIQGLPESSAAGEDPDSKGICIVSFLLFCLFYFVFFLVCMFFVMLGTADICMHICI